MRTFRRITSSDRDLMSVQNNIEQTLNPIARLALLDGTMLTGIALTTAAVKINHNLHRQPLGWFITDQNANAVVFRSGWTTTTISLQASAACTVNIWVF